jgi:hypothetical protein
MKKREVADMMGEKGRKTLISAVCFLVMFVIAAQPKLNGSDNPNQQSIFGEGWSITGKRGIRNSKVTKIEGTEELIYITYSQEPYIDVYDLSGSFLYCIQLPDSQNGAVSIDCRDGILIADAKGRNADGHDVFLFRGEELVGSMDHDQAREQGFVPIWNDQESDYLLTLTHVTRADGTVLFELPPEIAENMPKFLLTDGQEQVAKVLFVVLFAVFWLTVVGGCLRQILKKK